MTPQALSTYAASKGYGVLSTIIKGDGFWVNAKNAVSVDLVASTSPPTSGFPFDFKGVRINSMTFSSGVSLLDYGCNATLSFTNVSSVAVNVIFRFDTIVGGVTTGQTSFVTLGLAPGATATYIAKVFSNSSFPACGTFPLPLQFNTSASSVF